MGSTPVYGARAETPPPKKKNANFAMKQTNILCRLSGDINIYDFNSFANVKNDRDESRMASGRLFQVRGPAMANA